MTRWSFLVCIALSLSGLAVQAQSYPAKPLTIIVPYATGAADRIARTLAVKLSDKLGKSVVVDNKPGAVGTVGTMFAANARPDGYTLLVGDSGPLAMLPAMRKLNYDPKDFVSIGPGVSLPYVLATAASSA